MSDEPKYRQRGYQDSGRREERGGRSPQGPPPPKKEGPRGRGLGSPTETVFRCAACGDRQTVSDPMPADAKCTKCGADLHSCAHCTHFDTGSRWECRRHDAIPQRVEKKRAANSCPLWSPKEAAEFGRDRDRPAPTSPGDPKSARAAFDALFKR
jgi:hypothetical protein